MPREGTGGCWGRVPGLAGGGQGRAQPISPSGGRQHWELRETREVRVSREKPEKNELNRKMTFKVAEGSMSIEYW